MVQFFQEISVRYKNEKDVEETDYTDKVLIDIDEVYSKQLRGQRDVEEHEERSEPDTREHGRDSLFCPKRFILDVQVDFENFIRCDEQFKQV